MPVPPSEGCSLLAFASSSLSDLRSALVPVECLMTWGRTPKEIARENADRLFCSIVGAPVEDQWDVCICIYVLYIYTARTKVGNKLGST